MKFKYDKEVDIVYIKLSDKPVVESDEDKPGIIIDYDADGNIAGMEILDASNRMQDPYKLEYESTG
jgi:uncharacterized protein YuzE